MSLALWSSLLLLLLILLLLLAELLLKLLLEPLDVPDAGDGELEAGDGAEYDGDGVPDNDTEDAELSAPLAAASGMPVWRCRRLTGRPHLWLLPWCLRR